MINPEIRPYQAGDSQQICELFSRSSPYLRDSAFWVWINRMLGCEDSIVAVAAVGDLIVGHYAIIPQTMVIDNCKVPCGFGIHAVVEDQYRDAVSIYQISDLAYKIAKNKGLAFVYGFPNANYRLIQQKIERWKQVALFNAYELSSRELHTTTSCRIKPSRINQFEYSDICHLNEMLENRKRSPVELHKRLDYYLNRYIRHPQKPYQYYALKAGNGIAGYIFCKFYTKEQQQYFHIIDYILAASYTEKEMLASILEHFRGQCDTFSLWKGNTDFEAALVELGFNQSGFDTFLGIKTLNKNLLSESQQEILLGFDNWCLMMGDSDAF